MLDSVLPVLGSATRFCADRCFHYNSWDGDTARQFNGVTEHKMLASVASGFKIAYANWWVKSESSYPAATFPTCTEINGTRTLLIRASIEYPLGTYTEVTWSGSATLSLTAGSTTFSDDIATIPPKGATFRVHVYGSTNGTGFGIPYYWGNEATATTVVDVHNYSTVSGVTVDYHMQYHPSPAYNQNVMFPPVAIVGVTTAPAVAIIGDSIAHGWLDVANINEYHGAIGYYSASLTTLGIPHANYAQPAEAGYLFVSNSAKRRALVNAYASHAICNFWGNDYSAGRTLTQMQTMVTDIAGLITPPLNWTCAMPGTDSTDNWATETNQTTGGTTDENAHTDFNNYLLGGVSGIARVFNPRPAVEGTVNPAKWKGATPSLTADGIHLSHAGAAAIVAAGIIDTRVVGSFGVPFTAGAFALSGQAAMTRATRRIAAAAGSFTYAGQSASVRATRSFPIGQGGFALAGQDARLLYPKRIAAAYGSYSLAGQDAPIYGPQKLSASVGTVTLAGQGALLTRGKRLTAAQGAFALSGQNVTLAGPRSVVGSVGAFTLSGQSANLRPSRRLAAGAGALSLSGSAAAVSATRRLTTSAGSFAVAGQAAQLFNARRAALTVGVLGISGQMVLLRAARRLSATSASFSLAGQVVNFATGQHLMAQAGFVTVSGQSARIAATRKLGMGVGLFALSGQLAQLKVGRVAMAASGAFGLNGQPVRLARSGRMTGGVGSFALSGQPAALRRIRTLSAQSGSFALTGPPVQFRRALRLFADNGAFQVDGQDMALVLITKRPPPVWTRRFMAPAINRRWRAK